jgi:hypothetical protein
MTLASLLPREGEKVSAKPADEGARLSMQTPPSSGAARHLLPPMAGEGIPSA